MSNSPIPVAINLKKQSRVLQLEYEDGQQFELGFEFLRVHSPSAEVKGHGPGTEVLQSGKQEVGITAIEPVGNYAIKLVFDDGHDSGLYTWAYLHELGLNQENYWQQYLVKLDKAGLQREPQ